MKKLFQGEHTSSIEGEIENIEMNNLEGQILSNGLRAHRIGPQDSFTTIIDNNTTITSSPKSHVGRLETAF